MLDKYKNQSFEDRVLQLRLVFMDSERSLKATGEGRSFKDGTDSSFPYIQFKDFLPEAVRLCYEFGLYPKFSFNNESGEAILRVEDCSPEKATPPAFTETKIPFVPVKNARMNSFDVQFIGSQSTYLRRYLWIQFLDLCEHDPFDEGAITGTEFSSAAKNQKTPAQQVPVQQQMNPQQMPQQANPQMNPQMQAQVQQGQMQQMPQQQYSAEEIRQKKIEYYSGCLANINQAKKQDMISVFAKMGIQVTQLEQQAQSRMDFISDDWLRNCLVVNLQNTIAKLQNPAGGISPEDMIPF